MSAVCAHLDSKLGEDWSWCYVDEVTFALGRS